MQKENLPAIQVQMLSGRSTRSWGLQGSNRDVDSHLYSSYDNAKRGSEFANRRVYHSASPSIYSAVDGTGVPECCLWVHVFRPRHYTSASCPS